MLYSQYRDCPTFPTLPPPSASPFSNCTSSKSNVVEEHKTRKVSLELFQHCILCCTLSITRLQNLWLKLSNIIQNNFRFSPAPLRSIRQFKQSRFSCDINLATPFRVVREMSTASSVLEGFFEPKQLLSQRQTISEQQSLSGFLQVSRTATFGSRRRC